MGIGDRFGHQGRAQLEALLKAKQYGVGITPVWNKSYREHRLIGTQPSDTRREADESVTAKNWQDDYFVDADHISMKTVDLFIQACDFFTIDVADFIGRSADEDGISEFVKRHLRYTGGLRLPVTNTLLNITESGIQKIARKYLFAVEEAGRIYRHILKSKQAFIVEISFDETDDPQTPVELFFILAAVAQERIPAHTIAPKFPGRFNKGIDYDEDVDHFELVFLEFLAIIDFSVNEFALPQNLKLSIHSGSDKFSIYDPIRRALRKCGAGLHLKTAGTTWLEELIGLAEAGVDGLSIVKEIYRKAFSRYDELCLPYAKVIDIHTSQLPSPTEVDLWDPRKFTSTLRHNPTDKNYNPHFRQLLHIGYPIAAEMGSRYLSALQEYEDSIAKNVTENLYDRHIKKLFLNE